MPGWHISSGGGGSAASGDVVGPASSTDNAIARYDGTTGKLLQDSSVLVPDGLSGTVVIGSTGATDNAILRADGTGGSTAQSSSATINDSGHLQAALFYDTGNTFNLSSLVGGLKLISTSVVVWSSNTATNGPSDTSLARSAAGVVKVTDGSTGIRGLLGGGTAVASATALPVPTGRVFHVTGTTTITSLTSTNFQAGTVITIIFDDVLTFTDGNNLVLAGDFTTSANDTITLAYDGTNWYEVCRSVN